MTMPALELKSALLLRRSMQRGQHTRMMMLGLLLLGSACTRDPGNPLTEASPVPVRVAVARAQDVPRRIEAIGTLQALRSVAVRSPVDGTIQTIHLREGQDVDIHDRLVTLDRRPFAIALARARADLQVARAEADQARADLERYRGLPPLSTVSASELQQVVTRASTTEATVAARKAAAADAELMLAYSEIRAPIAGRTGQLLLHEGAQVRANDANSTIVTINQLTPIAAVYSVPAHELDAVQAAMQTGGIRVTVRKRKDDPTPAEGTLSFIDNTVDASTGTILLKASLENGDRALWPGQFVWVTTDVGADRNIVVIPTSAIQPGQTGLQVFVVRSDQTVEVRIVTVQRTVADESLIGQGVHPGETVVTDGQIRLLPGSKVTVHSNQENGTDAMGNHTP